MVYLMPMPSVSENKQLKKKKANPRTKLLGVQWGAFK